MLSALNLRMPTGHLYDRRHLSLRGIDLQHIYGDHGSLRGVCQHRVTRSCGLLNLNVHIVSTVSKHPFNIVRDIMPKVLHELLPLHVRFQTTYAPCTEITRQMRQSSIAHDRSPSPFSSWRRSSRAATIFHNVSIRECHSHLWRSPPL